MEAQGARRFPPRHSKGTVAAVGFVVLLSLLVGKAISSVGLLKVPVEDNKYISSELLRT